MVVLACLRHLCVKDYHVYQTGRPEHALSCEREAHNLHGEVAVA